MNMHISLFANQTIWVGMPCLSSNVLISTVYDRYQLDIYRYLYPGYKLYTRYIVFAFSVTMFVCLFVNFFSVKDFSAIT